MTLSLPDPSAKMAARSAQLQALIVEEIHAAGGWIPFGRYMERALYHPEFGYYSQLQGLGAEGDFVTAPEISPLFSRVVARQIAPVLESVGQPVVMELGAGSGAMAAEILLELERMGQLPQQYQILELSGGLRAKQQQTIAARAPHLLDRTVWLDRLPDQSFSGAIVANEVIDAIPVEQFVIRSDGPVPLGVSANPDGGLIWSERHDPAKVIEVPAVEWEGVEEGYRSEVRPGIAPWVASLADRLQQGMILLIDYGYGRDEYYRPERNRGTLSCFYRHHRHEDPLLWPGLQDITAHVDFSAVAEAADGAGLTVAGFSSQSYFLLGGGITGLAEQEALDDLQTRVETSRAIQQLTMPAQMGEVVKVMALTRGAALPETFTLHDQLHTL